MSHSNRWLSEPLYWETGLYEGMYNLQSEPTLLHRFSLNVIPEDQPFYCFPGADKRTRPLDVGRVRLLTSLTYSVTGATAAKPLYRLLPFPASHPLSRAIAGLRCHPSQR